MNKHDASYRRLFNNPHLVRSLFEGIIGLHKGLGHLDWSRLEPLPEQYVGRGLRERRGDHVWRIPLIGGQSSVFVVLLLEHQSKNDRYMALRIPTYCCLQYESLLQHKLIARGSLLPAILPVVLYSGQRPWSAVDTLSELIDPVPPVLAPYRLQARYLLVDEGVLVRAGGLPQDNLAALLFRLEHNQGIEEARQLMQTIISLTKSSAYTELRLALGEWVRYVMLPRALPEVDLAHASVNLIEINDMMTEHSRSWTHQWKMEGMQEGRRAEGELVLLQRLLARKFGPLPEPVQQRLKAATSVQLETWSLNILDATTLEEVFQE